MRQQDFAGKKHIFHQKTLHGDEDYRKMKKRL